jgi:hypothetical protein
LAVEAVAMRAKRRSYTGELATPIVAPAPPTFEGAVTDERVRQFWESRQLHQQEVAEQANRKLLEKMSLLMKHYGIADDGDLATLAWFLAFEHVPGFQVVEQVKTSRGRKRTWDGERLKELYDAVRAVKEQHRFNDRVALQFLVNTVGSKWQRPRNHKGSKQQWIETLESRLQDAKQYVHYVESLPQTLSDIRSAVLGKKFRK